MFATQTNSTSGKSGVLFEPAVGWHRLGPIGRVGEEGRRGRTSNADKYIVKPPDNHHSWRRQSPPNKDAPSPRLGSKVLTVDVGLICRWKTFDRLIHVISSSVMSEGMVSGRISRSDTTLPQLELKVALTWSRQHISCLVYESMHRNVNPS